MCKTKHAGTKAVDGSFFWMRSMTTQVDIGTPTPAT